MRRRQYNIQERFPYECRYDFGCKRGFVRECIKKIILWALNWGEQNRKEMVCQFGELAAIGFKFREHENDYIWNDLNILYDEVNKLKNTKPEIDSLDLLSLCNPPKDVNNKIVLDRLTKISKKRGIPINIVKDLYIEYISKNGHKNLEIVLSEINLILAEKQLKI